jgi:hypothetical protein
MMTGSQKVNNLEFARAVIIGESKLNRPAKVFSEVVQFERFREILVAGVYEKNGDKYRLITPIDGRHQLEIISALYKAIFAKYARNGFKVPMLVTPKGGTYVANVRKAKGEVPIADMIGRFRRV